MSSIRIVSTPPGQAPEWVRKEWIGVEIPLPEQNRAASRWEFAVAKQRMRGGHQVDTSKAIEALQKKSPRAAKW